MVGDLGDSTVKLMKEVNRLGLIIAQQKLELQHKDKTITLMSARINEIVDKVDKILEG